jgi:WD40 repeat protein
MNSPQRKLLKKRAAEEASLADADDDARDAARRRTLASLELKTVIRENHGAPTTTHVEFARGRGTRLSNLYATCGGRTATVYDDEHFGDHTAIVAQYVHETTEHQQGGNITAVCWVRSGDDTEDDKENVAGGSTRGRAHEFGDAILAVGDEHGVISVISVTENRVVARLSAHVGGPVRDMCSASERAGRVVSVGEDGLLKVWDIFGGKDGEGDCVQTINVETVATSVACDADGKIAVTGHAQGGAVRKWKLADGAKAPKTTKGETIPTHTFKAKHPIDCVRIYGDVLYAKTRDARVETFDLARGEPLRQWTLPNERYRGANAKYPGPACRFDCTSDGKFLACGDSCDSGVVYVYDTRTAELIAELKPLRVTGVVHAAAPVDHARRVLASYGPAVVWRYEIIPDAEPHGPFEVLLK